MAWRMYRRMVFFWLMMGFWWGSSLEGQATRTLLVGQVSGGVKPEISLRLQPPFGALVPADEYQQKLDKDGRFSFFLEISHPQTAVLTYREMSYEVFLMPGDSLYYEFSFSAVRTSSSFSGRGDAHNTAHLMMRQEFLQLQSADAYLSELPRNTTPFSLTRQLQTEEARQMAYLHSLSDDMQPDPVYLDIEKNNIRYGNALLKHNFFMGYTLDNGGRYEDYWTTSVEQLMEVYPLESPHGSALLSPAYREYLKLVLAYWYKKQHPEAGSERAEQIERKWRIVETRFPTDVQDYLYTYLILSKYPDPEKNIHTALNQDEYVRWLSRYRAVSKVRYFWELLTQEGQLRYQQATPSESNALTPESLAAVQFLEKDVSPLTAFTDFVNQNAGKVILVDFWASWCQPCLAVMPQLHRLQAEYKNEALTYLFVSMDQDREKWRKAAWKHRLNGTHLFAKDGFNADLAKLFGVRALPRYMLVDKQGVISVFMAASPAEIDQLRQQINALLY